MKHRLYAPTILCVGLLSAQIVSTAHVYWSNLNLQQATETVMRSGYLAVPNANVAEQLDSLTTAMAGGLFFTLSIGSGLSMMALIGVWLWDRVFRRQRKATYLFVSLWIASFFLINYNGWNLMASAYIAVIPLITGFTAVKWLPPRTTLLSPTGVLWPVSAAIILALLWSLVLDRHMFTNIRDHLLLTYRPGQSITEAYYAYTLFPAEAFKSLDQKQIRTCVLDKNLDRFNWKRIERALRARDYLPVPAGHAVDLVIGQDTENADFALKHSRKTILSIPDSELLGRLDEVLSAYSQNQDRNRWFRTLNLVSLLLGLPLVLFTFLFSTLRGVPNLFLTATVSDGVAAALCILVGAILLVPVYQGHSATVASTNPAISLSATSATTRIAALRLACENQWDITAEAQMQNLDQSPNIAERYWLARSMAYTRDPRALTILSGLADDPVPIVACQALWAMGQLKNRAVIPEIIDRINTSSHWYIQMYAYRALRTLGWVQPRSPQLTY